jgi:uncharacterized membrane protein YhaH (DUF805 family)
MTGRRLPPEHRVMNWTWYLFDFRGRINRARNWLAVLIILGFMILFGGLAIGLGHLFSLTDKKSFNLDLDDVFRIIDPVNWRMVARSELWLLFAKVIATGFCLWVYLATSIKRLHDRDKSGWWIVPFFILPGLYKQFEDRLPDSWWVLPLSLIVFGLLIWNFIELYCLRGSRGTNQYGPDPLDKKQTRARSAGARLRATTPGDQESEIEMVPRTNDGAAGEKTKGPARSQ